LFGGDLSPFSAAGLAGLFAASGALADEDALCAGNGVAVPARSTADRDRSFIIPSFVELAAIDS